MIQIIVEFVKSYIMPLCVTVPVIILL